MHDRSRGRTPPRMTQTGSFRRTPSRPPASAAPASQPAEKRRARPRGEKCGLAAVRSSSAPGREHAHVAEGLTGGVQYVAENRIAPHQLNRFQFAPVDANGNAVLGHTALPATYVVLG